MTEELIDSFYHLKNIFDDPLAVLFNLCDNLSDSSTITPKYYAFGGWVRDSLLGVKPSDLDFFISEPSFCNNIIQILKATGRIKNNRVSKDSHYNSQFSTYHFKFITNSSEMIKIDLVTLRGEESVPDCDFTCNNLILTSDGSISTRLSSPDKGVPESQWTMRCMQDVIGKRLVWILPRGKFKISGQDFEKRLELSWKMEYRLQKMLDKGFTLSKVNLTGFQLVKLKSHLDVEVGQEPSECCGICQESFLAEECDHFKKSTKLTCGHDYHYKCIRKWKIDQKKDTCPICRAKIYYATF